MSLSGNDKGTEVLLKERQTFRLGWLHIPFIALSAFLIALSLYIIYLQLFQSSPATGGGPLSDGGVVIIVTLMLVVGIGLPAFVFRAELLVTVDREALRISFAPFTHRMIPVQSILLCEPYTIQPIRDYIGVGILISLKDGSVGYAVSGNEGVKIEFDDGKQLFVGSQYPEALASAVAVARSL
jgi:hypothetical protein